MVRGSIFGLILLKNVFGVVIEDAYNLFGNVQSKSSAFKPTVQKPYARKSAAGKPTVS